MELEISIEDLLKREKIESDRIGVKILSESKTGRIFKGIRVIGRSFYRDTDNSRGAEKERFAKSRIFYG